MDLKEDTPTHSSDEDVQILEEFTIRDHDLDAVTFRTGKLISIRSLDLVREHLEWCQIEPRIIRVTWDNFKHNIFVKCDEIKFLSNELMSHRLGIENKEQTAIFNRSELGEVVLAMLYKKQSVRRAFKYFIRSSHTTQQKQLIVAKVKDTYSYFDIMDYEIELYSKLLGFPSPALDVALSKATSSVGQNEVRDDSEKLSPTKSSDMSSVPDSSRHTGEDIEKSNDKNNLTETLKRQTRLLKEHDEVILKISKDAEEASASGDVLRLSNTIKNLQSHLKVYQKQQREHILASTSTSGISAPLAPPHPLFSRPPPVLPTHRGPVGGAATNGIQIDRDEHFDELPPDQLLAFYQSLPGQWRITPDFRGPVKSAAAFRDSITVRFDGNTENYAHWQ